MTIELTKSFRHFPQVTLPYSTKMFGYSGGKNDFFQGGICFI
jgi:hypothetical protein